MAEKLINSTGLSEFSKKIKENAVFIKEEETSTPAILDLIYPVGSIYMSVNNVSPATFIGGTWSQIQDTFLLAAGSSYTAGSTGGSSTVKLTSANLPTHTHTYDKSSTSTASHTLTNAQLPKLSGKLTFHGAGWSVPASNMHQVEGVFTGTAKNQYVNFGSGDTQTGAVSYPEINFNIGGGTGHSHNITLTSTNSGNGGFSNTAHDNMPPYLTVYMWRRTA